MEEKMGAMSLDLRHVDNKDAKGDEFSGGTTGRDTSFKEVSSVCSFSSESSLELRDPKLIHYVAERKVGQGAFGSVYLAKEVSTHERVAIKKVLQDRKHVNRELTIMKKIARYPHPNVIQLRKYFVTKGVNAEEIYLNLVLDYVPATLHSVFRSFSKTQRTMPIIKIVMYQLARALAHIHGLGITHRDLKPQNVLMNEESLCIKLCDFGSAKSLVPGQPNVAYICSRHYRAPELIFGSTEYFPAIDVWSLGCIMAELMIGSPLFPGCSAVDQIVEVIKVLGAPTQVQLVGMDPSFTNLRLPQLIAKPLRKRFAPSTPPFALDMLSDLLQYVPTARPSASEIYTFPFFDDLRLRSAALPDGRPLPASMFHFTPQERQGRLRFSSEQK